MSIWNLCGLRRLLRKKRVMKDLVKLLIVMRRWSPKLQPCLADAFQAGLSQPLNVSEMYFICSYSSVPWLFAKRGKEASFLPEVAGIPSS